MRRIAIALTLIAIVAGIYACAADAPTAPKPPGGGNSSAVQVQLYTTNANPKAGTCTVIGAIVTFNGNSVPDGTSVNFSTDFGSFGQNGLPLVSVVTTNGIAVTALCGPGAGTAKVKGQVTVSGKTNSGTISISFQPDSGTLPFVSSCSPSFGPKEGGTTLTLNGGRLASTTRVQFTANGVTRDGVITAVAANGTSVTVLTPGFPELSAPTTPAAITMTLLAVPTSVTLSVPSCFAYGASDAGTPTISSLLPSSGTNEGHTRVTIIGSGFSSSGVQVFFGSAEATVVSVSYNQVIVLSPPAFGSGQPNLNQTVGVTVKNISSGQTSGAVNFTYTPAVRLTSIAPSEAPSDGPFVPVTIFGQGFQAPVAVVLAGRPASVISVAATEIVVLPTTLLVSDCNDVSGDVVVTNINSGDTATGLSFLYLVKSFAPTLSFSSPNSGDVTLGQVSVTIFGSNLLRVTKVTFGARAASFTIDNSGQITAIVPDNFATAPTCAAGVAAGTETKVEEVDIEVTSDTGCKATLTKAFVYLLQCTVPPTPTP